MAESSQVGNSYSNVQNYGGQTHMGNVYNNGETSDERALRAILESLSYPGMDDRRDALAEAHAGTFDWTFLEGRTDFVTSRRFNEYDGEEYIHTQEVDMNFKTWLEGEDQGLFCVEGKPGSGKSTFMKSLATSSDLDRILKTWAGDNTLIQADHYFWILGSAMQKTVEGLLRSLIYTVLCTLAQPRMSANLEVISHISGSRWSSKNTRKAWSCTEMKEMLSRLSSTPKVKSFFLIDALDECEPQDGLHHLTNLVLWISRLPNVKLCVSCRPWKTFTRNFEHCPTILLHRLTYHDMEVYVKSELISAEKDLGCNNQFRDPNSTASNFIQHVASAADGVFLWTKLVTQTICSDIRKGKTLKQLEQAMSEFPVDLEGYFHKLIFDRIVKSRSNILDTAATLKLALEISKNEKRIISVRPWGSSLHAKSFCNFWLLCNGFLAPDFSWTDHIDPTQLQEEAMLRQTESFLHETSKDLLVVRRGYLGEWEVDFLHRTVFDFLCEGEIGVLLEQHAPKHFSYGGFITDLAKLRCICLLSGAAANCVRSLDIYSEILPEWQGSALDIDMEWLSACESLTLSRLQKRCTCFGLGHRGSLGLLKRSLDARRYQFLMESTASMPHLLSIKEKYDELDYNFAGEFCQSLSISNVDIGNSGMRLLRHVLNCGGHTSSYVGEWLHVDDPVDDHPLRGSRWCDRTYWEALLSGIYVQLEKEEKEKGVDIRKRRTSAIVELLLQYGADPDCSPCITDHIEEPENGGRNCRHMALATLLRLIVPAERLVPLRNLLSTCSTGSNLVNLRRNQNRRAIKSYVISEHNFAAGLAEAVLQLEERLRIYAMWNRHQDEFLGCIMNLKGIDDIIDQDCHRCHEQCDWSGLTAWCVDCQASSLSCIDCYEQYPFEPPHLEHSSAVFPGMPGMNHTSIVAPLELDPLQPLHHGPRTFLHSQYSVAQALSVLKEWYYQNPI